MYNNKDNLRYEEILIPMGPNDDLVEMINRVGYDFEGTHIKNVYVIDRAIYRFPVILLGNRIFYCYDVIAKYLNDVAECKDPQEINTEICNYATSRLFSPDDNKNSKKY